MRNSILRLVCGILGLCFHLTMVASAAEDNGGSQETSPIHYFASGGMLNGNYQAFDKGTRWVINKCKTDYEVGTRCPIPESFADKIFTVKAGMYIKTFKDSRPTCIGKIEGFDFISYESMDGFFLRTECKSPSFAVIARSKAELKQVLPGEVPSEVVDSSVIATLRDRIIGYYTTRPDDLRDIISEYGRNTEKLTETELLDILKLETNIQVTAIHPNKSKEAKAIYFIVWGSKRLYVALPSDKIQYLGFSEIRQHIKINGDAYILANQKQPGTGVSVDNLFIIEETGLTSVFSEGGFSD